MRYYKDKFIHIGVRIPFSHMIKLTSTKFVSDYLEFINNEEYGNGVGYRPFVGLKTAKDYYDSNGGTDKGIKHRSYKYATALSLIPNANKPFIYIANVLNHPRSVSFSIISAKSKVASNRPFSYVYNDKYI